MTSLVEGTQHEHRRPLKTVILVPLGYSFGETSGTCEAVEVHETPRKVDLGDSRQILDQIRSND